MRLVIAVLVAALATPVCALELGQAIPVASHSVADVEGRRWMVGSVGGEHGTLVLFICVHCPWVKKWNQRIADLGSFALESGIGVLAVNSNDPGRMTQDGPEGMRRQIAEFGFRFPYAIDSGSVLARAYGAQRTPEAFLFDAGGALVYHGTIDDNAASADGVEAHFLRDAIAAVAVGQKPSPAETKALGCTIKMYPER